MEVKLRLIFSEEEKPFLLDITSLFYDFELSYDFSLMLCVEDYYDYRFSRNFWFRHGRPIKSEHRLRVVKIVKESPLTIESGIAGFVASTSTIWILLQIIEKIQNWKLNREKLKLEVDKLKLEKDKLKLELEQKAKEREGLYILEPLVRRIDQLPMKLADLEIITNENKEDRIIFH